jgi:hypothetical protein
MAGRNSDRQRHTGSSTSLWGGNPFVYWLLLILSIAMLIAILSFASIDEGHGGTKVIFPVRGTITKCPLHVKNAVKECHSGLNSVTELPDSEYSSRIREVLNRDGTYVIRIR